MNILVRPRAWWFNKIPLSVFMLVLLVDGKPLTVTVLVSLIGLVGIVSCVANYGYALNELFDRDEDRRAGRSNAAESSSNSSMWRIIACSAAVALGVSQAVGGIAAALLTIGELLIPLAYSVPPLRVKERGWAGILADALAAHVYPAVLAMLVVSHQLLPIHHPVLIVCIAIWSLATGLRGILSHQLQSEESDRDAGLTTVVHRLGHQRLVRLIVFVILPIEIVMLATLLLQSDATVFLKTVAIIFTCYEYLKFHFNLFPVLVFTRQGQHYLPFVDEGFYKVWAPLALIVDAAFTDILYLMLIPTFVLMFRPRIKHEWAQISSATKAVSIRMHDVFAKRTG
jgi:4-hydroxybenzoate polyprenyltransferase